MNVFNLVKCLLYACVLSLILFGCTNAERNGGIHLENEEPVVLKLWGGVPSEAGPQNVLDMWNSEHPNIQIEYVKYSNDKNGNLRLDTALLNENDVDLFFNYFTYNYKKRVKMDLVANLSVMNGIFDIEEKIGTEAKEWEIDENYYAVPTKKNYHFVLLNKDALAEAELTVPDNWTWKELKEYAKQLTTDNRWGFVQYDFVLPYPIDGTLGSDGYTKSDGSSNFDNVVVSEHLQLLYNMMHHDKSTPLLSKQLAMKMPIDMLFLKGEAAVLFGGEWVLRYLNNLQTDDMPQFDIAFAPIPKISENQTNFKYVGGVGDAISINVNSHHKKEALQFIKWYVDEGIYGMAEGGRLPASRDADLEKALHTLTNKNRRIDKDSLNRIMNGDLPIMQIPLGQEVIDMRKEEFENYLSGTITLEETMDRLVERHNSKLQKNRSNKLLRGEDNY